jgi:iron complex transport system substrate-binding protein
MAPDRAKEQYGVSSIRTRARSASRILVVTGMGAALVAGCSSTASTAPSGSTGASSAPSAAASGKTVTLTDFRGRTMTVPVGTKHVVFLVENAMNTFYSVGGAENISGIGEIWQPTYKEAFFKAVDKDFATTTKVASKDSKVDLETLAAAKPDLVVLWSGSKDDADTVAIQESLKIPVYGVYLTSFNDLTKLTTDMAAIVGNPTRGAEVVETIAKEMKKITDVSSTIPTASRPSVYWMWGDVFGTAGTGSTMNDLIDAAGGVNVVSKLDDATKATEHPILSMETIAKLDPDVIYMWFNPDIDPADIIAGKKVGNFDFATWSNLKAVKEKKVFELDNPFLYDAMTGRQPVATVKIAKDINPTAFASWSLDSEIDSYFVSVYGLHYPSYTSAK